jgi:hypothetical protein
MRLILTFLASIYAFSFFAQATVGLTNYTYGNLEGYVLFSPMRSTSTFLIDKCGEKVHEWNTSTYRPGLSSYLLEDGSLIRAGILDNVNFDEGGSGGIIEKFDWDGNLVWNYTLSDNDICQHHDIAILPNGNVLAIVWDRYTNAEAISKGKNTSYGNSHLWSEKIVELQPLGSNDATIVWEWKIWDHLVQDFDNTKPDFGVVSEHPELIDLNYFPGQPTSMDWIHLNSIDFNPSLNQILLSSHTFNEVWIIDHSTTTSEASEHVGGNSNKGGDLLYRWGNPQAYDRGTPNTKVFFGQHHATWIPPGFPNEGNILVFNNGLNRPGLYSSIDMIETPINSSQDYPIDASSPYLPNALFWTYTASNPSDFYSSNISGVYPLEKGSFLITSGANGIFFEVNTENETVWEYVNPIVQGGALDQGDTPSNNFVFRSNFYPNTYPAFIGKTLIPAGEIEGNPSEPSICEEILMIKKDESLLTEIQVYPNPFNDFVYIDFKTERSYQVELTDVLGQLVVKTENTALLDLKNLNAGIYNLTISTSDGDLITFKLIK